MEMTTICGDLAGRIFQVHGADAAGLVVDRKALRRSQVLRRTGAIIPIVPRDVIERKVLLPGQDM